MLATSSRPPARMAAPPWIRLAILAALLCLVLVAVFSFHLQDSIGPVLEWIDQHRVGGAAAFVAIYALATGTPRTPAYAIGRRITVFARMYQTQRILTIKRTGLRQCCSFRACCCRWAGAQYSAPRSAAWSCGPERCWARRWPSCSAGVHCTCFVALQRVSCTLVAGRSTCTVRVLCCPVPQAAAAGLAEDADKQVPSLGGMSPPIVLGLVSTHGSRKACPGLA